MARLRLLLAASQGQAKYLDDANVLQAVQCDDHRSRLSSQDRPVRISSMQRASDAYPLSKPDDIIPAIIESSRTTVIGVHDLRRRYRREPGLGGDQWGTTIFAELIARWEAERTQACTRETPLAGRQTGDAIASGVTRWSIANHGVHVKPDRFAR